MIEKSDTGLDADQTSVELQPFAGHFAVSCAGKVAFKCKADALKASDAARRRSKRRHFRGRPKTGAPALYKCEHCKQWHIGRKG